MTYRKDLAPAPVVVRLWVADVQDHSAVCRREFSKAVLQLGRPLLLRDELDLADVLPIRLLVLRVVGHFDQHGSACSHSICRQDLSLPKQRVEECGFSCSSIHPNERLFSSDIKHPIRIEERNGADATSDPLLGTHSLHCPHPHKHWEYAHPDTPPTHNGYPDIQQWDLLTKELSLHSHSTPEGHSK
jgi:hypothetical protein